MRNRIQAAAHAVVHACGAFALTLAGVFALPGSTYGAFPPYTITGNNLSIDVSNSVDGEYNTSCNSSLVLSNLTLKASVVARIEVPVTAISGLEVESGTMLYSLSVTSGKIYITVNTKTPARIAEGDGYILRHVSSSLADDEEVAVYTKTGSQMTWTKPTGVSAISQYLVIGGGGAGGGSGGSDARAKGGGGAGRFVENTSSVPLADIDSLTITVGAGGTVSSSSAAKAGGESKLVVGSTTVTAPGGGQGGTQAGFAGGCGGGAGAQNGTSKGGSASSGVGFGCAGGDVDNSSSSGSCNAGGGGGAGDSGDEGTSSAVGDGGPGKSSGITGATLYYAGGGGGGGGGSRSYGQGGQGGGGNGNVKGGNGTSGVDGSGGGGGGGGRNNVAISAAGGSGVVILRYTVSTKETIAYTASGDGSYTYDGTAHGIAVNVTDPASGATVKFRDGASGAYTLDASPTQTGAGTKTIGFKITADGYNDVEDSRTITVTQASITAVTLTSSSATYDGNAHQPTVASVTANGKTFTDASTGWDVSYKRGDTTTTDFTSAGTITVTATGKSNLTGSKSATFTINPAIMSVSATGYSAAYDGQAHGITVNVSKPASGYTVKYRTTTSGEYTTEEPKLTNFGSQTVYYQVTAANYTTVTGSETITINKATNAWTTQPSINPSSWVAGQKTASDFTIAGEAKFGTVQCGKKTAELAALTAGNYDVSFTVQGTDNYEGLSETVSVTVSASTKPITDCTVTLDPANGQIPYTGNTIYIKDHLTVTDGGTTLVLGTHYTLSGHTGQTSLGNYGVYVDGKGEGGYTGQKTVNWSIVQATTAISNLQMPSFAAGTPLANLPSPSCTVTPSVATVTYSYWDNQSCTGTPIARGDLPSAAIGTYYVKATVEDCAEYTAAEATKSFEVYDPAAEKTVVYLPAVVSKPYSGSSQKSGLQNTSGYTVLEPTGHTDVGTYGVTLTLTSAKYKWWDDRADAARTEDLFVITKADNAWSTVPTISKTQWFEREAPATLNDYKAKWGDDTKTNAWYYVDPLNTDDRTALDPQPQGNNFPTAVSNYVLVITVPGTDNYRELTRELGFTICEGNPTVDLPVLADKEYTGAKQESDVPASLYYKVVANESGTAVGQYTVTLQLLDPGHKTWTLGGTADRSVTWNIVKAKNSWTQEPALSTNWYAVGGTVAVLRDGVAKWGGKATQNPSSPSASSAGTHTVTWTVAAGDNYEALTKTSTYVVGNAGSTQSGDFVWTYDGSGAWKNASNWKNAIGYPDSDTANVTFNNECTANPITVTLGAGAMTRIKSLTVADNAPSDITLDLDGITLYGAANKPTMGLPALHFPKADGSLSVAANHSLTIINGTLYHYYDADDNLATATLGENAKLTIRPGAVAYGDGSGTLHLGKNRDFAASISSLTMSNGAELTIDGELARLGFDKAILGYDTTYKLRAVNGGAMQLTSKDFSNDKVNHACTLEVDDGLIVLWGELGTGTSSSTCRTPRINVSGSRGQVYGLVKYGSNTELGNNALTITIKVPAGGFVNKLKCGGAKDTLVNAPLGGAAANVVVGGNVIFKIDLQDDLAARPELSTVSLLRNYLADGSGILTVPGASGGKLTKQSDLDDWYKYNFTVTKGSTNIKNDWKLYFDVGSQTLVLRRKGAYEYDQTGINGYMWTHAGAGQWSDASKWDIWRVPQTTHAFVRFGDGSSYVRSGTMTPVTVDLLRSTWNYRTLAFSETVNLTLKNGTLSSSINSAAHPTYIHDGSDVTFDNVTLDSAQQYLQLDGDSTQPVHLTFANGSSMPSGRIDYKGDGTARKWQAGDAIRFTGKNASGSQDAFGVLCLQGADTTELISVIVTNKANIRINKFAQGNVDVQVVGEGSSLDIGSLMVKPLVYACNIASPIHWSALESGSFTLNGEYPYLDKGCVYDRMVGQHFTASNGTMTVQTFSFGYADPNRQKLVDKKPYYFHPELVSNCVLKVGGRKGLFHAAGKLILGADETAALTIPSPPTVEIVWPTGGFESGAPIKGDGVVHVGSNTFFRVNLNAVQTGEKFPLISAQTLKVDCDYLTANARIEVAADSGIESTAVLTKDNNTLYLLYTVGDKEEVEAPGNVTKPYTGNPQKSGLEATAYYTVEQDEEKTDKGTYDVILKLRDPAKYVWKNPNMDDPAYCKVSFTITPAQNEWTTAPKIDKAWWYVNETPGNVTDGAAKWGVVQKTQSWGAGPIPSVKGNYSIEYKVEEGNWTALSATISFTVCAQGETPVGPKDETATVYTWKNQSGDWWTITNNWESSRSGSYGYPDEKEHATAIFSAQHEYASGMTVHPNQSIKVVSMVVGPNANPVTLDFTDYMLTAAQFAVSNNQENVLLGGTFNCGALTMNASAKLTVAKDAAFNVYGGNLALQGAKLTVAGQVMATNATANAATTATVGTTVDGTELELSGSNACLTVKGSLAIGSWEKEDSPGNAPKLTFVLGEHGFVDGAGNKRAPLQATPYRSGKQGVVVIKQDTKLSIDATKLVAPGVSSDVTEYPLVSADLLTCADAALVAMKNGQWVTLPANATADLAIADNTLKLVVTWKMVDMAVGASSADLTVERKWLGDAYGTGPEEREGWETSFNKSSEDPNGLTGWEAYVLGYDASVAGADSARLALKPMQTGPEGKVRIQVENTPDTKSQRGGKTVQWKLQTNTTTGSEGWSTYGDPAFTPQFDAPLPGTGVQYYRIKSYIKDIDPAE